MIYCKDCGRKLTFADLALMDTLIPTCCYCQSTNLEDTEVESDDEVENDDEN